MGRMEYIIPHPRVEMCSTHTCKGRPSIFWEGWATCTFVTSRKPYLNFIIHLPVIGYSRRSRKNIWFALDPKSSRHEFCQILPHHFLSCFLRWAQIFDALVFGWWRRRKPYREVLIKNKRVPKEYVGIGASDLDPVLRILERIAIKSIYVFLQPNRLKSKCSILQICVWEAVTWNHQGYRCPPWNCKSFSLITY